MLHHPPPAKGLYSSAQSSSLRWCLDTPHLRIGFFVVGRRRRDAKDDDWTPTFVVQRNLCIVRWCCGSSRLPYSHSFAVDNLRRFPTGNLISAQLNAPYQSGATDVTNGSPARDLMFVQKVSLTFVRGSRKEDE